MYNDSTGQDHISKQSSNVQQKFTAYLGFQPSSINNTRRQYLSAKSSNPHKIFRSDYTDTPAMLALIYPSIPADCWRCSLALAAAEHIFCSCPQIQQFLTKDTPCISEVLMVPVPLTIRMCLLGLVEEVILSRAHRTLLNTLLFYGRKAILQRWKKPGAPDILFLEKAG